MLQLIREVYANVKAMVHTDKGLTDFFKYKLGVRQGSMLSPRLFIIFINELEKMLKNSKFRGISVGNAIEVFFLMYADDIVSLGNTVLVGYGSELNKDTTYRLYQWWQDIQFREI